MLTQERLKELFHYDPETGVFTRLVKTSSQGNLGVVKNKPTNTGYIKITIDKKQHYAHRLAWLYVYGCFPFNQIDHISHDGADNRISNLREATSKENNMNRSIGAKNKSGFVGVCWHKRDHTWQTTITSNYKLYNLGTFKNKEDAIAARKAANIKYGFHENHGKELFDSGEQTVYNQRCRNGKTQQQHEKGKQHEFRF